jgi:hypothetical protein
MAQGQHWFQPIYAVVEPRPDTPDITVTTVSARGTSV